MKRNYKGLFYATLMLGFILTGCGGGSTSTSGSSSQIIPSGGQGSLFFASSDSGNGSGSVTYYVPVYNTSIASTTVSSVSATNSDVWAVGQSSDVNSCGGIDSGGPCFVPITFNSKKITLTAQLNSTLTATLSNSTASSVSMSGVIVPAGNDVFASMPAVIVTNESGTAKGFMVVYNESATESKIINTSGIAATTQPGVSWKFAPFCDATGSAVIAPLSGCVISYTYTTSALTTPESVSITVPYLGESSGSRVAVTSPTQVIKPSTPYLVAANPGTLYVPKNGSATYIIGNYGSGILNSITTTSSSGYSSTSNCNNIAPNQSCTITISNPGNVDNGNVTLTPSGSALPTSMLINLSSQILSTSPTGGSTVAFGDTNFNGAVITKVISVNNNSAQTITGLHITQSDINAAYAVDLSTCSNSLTAFSSCVIRVTYAAPNISATQAGMITIAADNQTTQTINLAAGSGVSSWGNLVASFNFGSTYYYLPVVSYVADTIDDQKYQYFGVGALSSTVGNQDLWIESNGVANAMSTGIGYESGVTPTVILSATNEYSLVVGYYNGSLQWCSNTVQGEGCMTIYESSPGLMVTSIIGGTGGGNVGYAGRINKMTGQLLYFPSVEYFTPIAGIESAVGKMVIDDITDIDRPLRYAPLSDGRIVVVASNAIITANIAPVLPSGEYPTVLYIEPSSNFMDFGTNKGNVYRSTKEINLITSNDWSKLTVTPLSDGSIVSGITLDKNGRIYVGLANLASPTTGGALYVMVNLASPFTLATGYGDTTSVFQVTNNEAGNVIVTTYGYTGNNTNVSYGGKIWQLN